MKTVENYIKTLCGTGKYYSIMFVKPIDIAIGSFDGILALVSMSAEVRNSIEEYFPVGEYVVQHITDVTDELHKFKKETINQVETQGYYIVE